MSAIEYILLFGTVIIGGGIAFYVDRQYRTTLQWILSFSGSYILGISVLHLMPVAFKSELMQPGLWILAGFFIQLLLEQLSQGVEHGHIHAPHHPHNSFALQLMIGLCVHAFIEGMPLSSYSSFHAHTHEDGEAFGSMHLLLGIMLHKAPAAFALVSLLLLAKFRRIAVLLCLIVFALMSPLGAGLAEWLEVLGMLDEKALSGLIALVVGSFLHIATTIIFEMDSSSHHHRISWQKLLAIIAGLGMALATMH